MSQQNNLKKLLICLLCNQTLNDPIILPCFNFICLKHVSTKTYDDRFKSTLCEQEHQINAGFGRNENLNQLIKISDKCVLIDVILGPKTIKQSNCALS